VKLDQRPVVLDAFNQPRFDFGNAHWITRRVSRS
jgi:hypothetical protein